MTERCNHLATNVSYGYCIRPKGHLGRHRYDGYTLKCISCNTPTIRDENSGWYVCPNEECPSHRYDDHKVVK